jgi:hypothetical protein
VNQRYLDVTFRNGKPVAAYLYLPREADGTSARAERREGGLLIDYAEDDRPIGIEITAPQSLSLAALNRVLADLDQQPATDEELALLAAA